MIKITDKLNISCIEANNWEHDEDDREITTAFFLCFTFYGYTGFEAYVDADKLTNEFESFGIVESSEGDLHDSFMEQLEEHWQEIVKHIQAWEKARLEEAI